MRSILLVFTCLLAACAPAVTPALQASPTSQVLQTNTLTPVTSETPVATIPPTLSPTASHTPTATGTFTPTLTQTPTFTPSITATPTFAFPTFKVTMQAHCRYGPAKAFLHAGDLYAGDTGVVWGRYIYSNWLYVRLDKLTYPCWVAPSVIQVTGDISTLRYREYTLPGPSELYGPPAVVSAARSGDQVTISWSVVPMTVDDDRGYQIDMFVCQNGNYLWWPVSFPDQYTTSYTITDQAGCSQPSEGKLAAVEKHGYTTWVTIPWPAP